MSRPRMVWRFLRWEIANLHLWLASRLLYDMTPDSARAFQALADSIWVDHDDFLRGKWDGR